MIDIEIRIIFRADEESMNDYVIHDWIHWTCNMMMRCIYNHISCTVNVYSLIEHVQIKKRILFVNISMSNTYITCFYTVINTNVYSKMI